MGGPQGQLTRPSQLPLGDTLGVAPCSFTGNHLLRPAGPARPAGRALAQESACIALWVAGALRQPQRPAGCSRRDPERTRAVGPLPHRHARMRPTTSPSQAPTREQAAQRGTQQKVGPSPPTLFRPVRVSHHHPPPPHRSKYEKRQGWGLRMHSQHNDNAAGAHIRALRCWQQVSWLTSPPWRQAWSHHRHAVTADRTHRRAGRPASLAPRAGHLTAQHLPSKRRVPPDGPPSQRACTLTGHGRRCFLHGRGV